MEVNFSYRDEEEGKKSKAFLLQSKDSKLTSHPQAFKRPQTMETMKNSAHRLGAKHKPTAV